MAENLETPLVLRQVEQLQHGTAVVVALNGPNRRGASTELSADTMARHVHAGAVAIVGGFDVMCVGGEAEQNRQWMKDHFGMQLGALAIYADDSSRDTVGNAISTRRFIEQHKVDKVGVVTLPYHMPRAQYVFNRLIDAVADVIPCAPEDTVHTLPRRAYLRMAQLPIYTLNEWQLRGYDQQRDGALEQLERRLTASNPRYDDLRGGDMRRLLHILDRATSSRRS